MVWTIEWDRRAVKEMKKISQQAQKAIMDYLKKNVSGAKNPKHVGKALKGNKNGLWRYRIGDYRVICHHENQQCVVLVLRVGHRQSIYC